MKTGCVGLRPFDFKTSFSTRDGVRTAFETAAHRVWFSSSRKVNRPVGWNSNPEKLVVLDLGAEGQPQLVGEAHLVLEVSAVELFGARGAARSIRVGMSE